jgi:hypothetical protein
VGDERGGRGGGQGQDLGTISLQVEGDQGSTCLERSVDFVRDGKWLDERYTQLKRGQTRRVRRRTGQTRRGGRGEGTEPILLNFLLQCLQLLILLFGGLVETSWGAGATSWDFGSTVGSIRGEVWTLASLRSDGGVEGAAFRRE